MDAARIHPLLLAYIGDAVYELRVREHLLRQGAVRMRGLHAQAVSYVKAERQSRFYTELEALLTDEERDVLRHARNAKSGHQPPNIPAAAYRRATGVEALIGCLHLSGREARLDELFAVLFADSQNAPPPGAAPAETEPAAPAAAGTERQSGTAKPAPAAEKGLPLMAETAKKGK